MGANAAGATGGCEGGSGDGGNETCWNDIAVKTKAVCCIYL